MQFWLSERYGTLSSTCTYGEGANVKKAKGRSLGRSRRNLNEIFCQKTNERMRTVRVRANAYVGVSGGVEDNLVRAV